MRGTNPAVSRPEAPIHGMLCFVSLRVDLRTVWYGLGRGECGGIEQIIFSCILSYFVHFCNPFCIGDFGRLPLGPVLGRAAPLGRGTTLYLRMLQGPQWVAF